MIPSASVYNAPCFLDLRIDDILNRAIKICSTNPIRLETNVAFAILADAQIAFANNDLLNAKMAFKKVIQYEERCTLAHALLGEIFRQEENFDEAQASFEKALSLGYNNTFIHGRLACIFWKRDRNVQKAVDHLNKSIALGVTCGFTQAVAGDMLLAYNNLEYATLAFKLACDLGGFDKAVIAQALEAIQTKKCASTQQFPLDHK